MRKKKPDNSWLERQKNILAQGRTSPVSKDASQYIQGVYPSHAEGVGHRCYIEDCFGNSYVDFVCGLGALSLGYNAKVTEAALRQTRRGASFSLPTTLEIETAETLAGLIPSGEKWRFFKNGRDATDCAVRVARTYTKKEIIYSKGYHGCSDGWVSITPPSLGIVGDHKVRSFKEISDIDFSLAAGVIVEALELTDDEPYQTWIRELRAECKKQNVVFIIDEIITGFRVPKYTVSNWWSLDPDIILLGKGMANGWPLSAIAGKRDLMDCAEWFFSMTFSGDAVALAACEATIEEISQKSLTDLMFYGKRLQTKLNALHPDVQWQGYGTRAMLNTAHETTALFMQEFAKAGFLFGKAFFFNFAHLEDGVEGRVISTGEAIQEQIKQGRIKLEGKRPQELFKR